MGIPDGDPYRGFPPGLAVPLYPPSVSASVVFVYVVFISVVGAEPAGSRGIETVTVVPSPFRVEIETVAPRRSA
jgi:hypothetical protein